MRLRTDDGPEISREGEKRTRHRLGRAIARQEGVVADPARRHKGLAQERQHDVAAAEHQRARAVKGVKKGQAFGMCNIAKNRQPDKEEKENRQRKKPCPARDRNRQVTVCCIGSFPAEPKPGKAAKRDRTDLSQRRKR